MNNFFLFFYFCITIFNISASIDTDKTYAAEKNIGNFTNDRSPSTVFGFGQFILDEGNTNLYLYIEQDKGQKQNSVTLFPLVAYGIADYLSAYCSLPLIVSCYENGIKSHGLGDLTAQFEYVFWQLSKPIDVWATIVANLTLPTANTLRNQSLGLGSPSFFLGTTISMLSTKWYAYAEAGGSFVATKYKCIKPGNCFLYEWGFGYNLASQKNTAITMLFDFNGIYTQKDVSNTGISDPNSGGNIVYIGPTLFYSYKSWAITFGIQGPALQALNGTQNKQYYRTLFSASVQF